MSKTLYNLYNVGPHLSPMLTPFEKYYKKGELPVAAPNLIVGLELEIEKWRHSDTVVDGFQYKSDGSLRGNSVEAVTYPLPSWAVEDRLTRFFETHKITANNYSERCGTHVHMDVSQMTMEQLATFCQLYCVFERLLFKFAGLDRQNNIFCVPWEHTNLGEHITSYLKQDPQMLSRSWQKYTALNLAPIRTFGSVEFRHLAGTCDVKFLVTWLNLIGSLYNYSVNNTNEKVISEINSINTSSAYNTFAQAVFGEWFSYLDSSNLQMDMETGVINVKVMSLGEFKSTKKKHYSMQYEDQPLDVWMDEQLTRPAPDPGANAPIIRRRGAQAGGVIPPAPVPNQDLNTGRFPQAFGLNNPAAELPLTARNMDELLAAVQRAEVRRAEVQGLAQAAAQIRVRRNNNT